MTTEATHPRPFLQRSWVSLDGRWDFRVDADAAFRSPADVDFDTTITVPFAPETPASGIGPEALDGEFVRGCWYRRRLDLEPAEAGERVFLHFGGVDREADVWVVDDDGAHHVARHVGGYTGFAADVTDHLGPSARLVVRALDDPLDLEVPRGKQDWNAVPHAIWYPPTTGIWKTVWAERVATTHLTDIVWTPDVATMSLTMRATIHGPRPAGLRLRVVLSARDAMLVDDEITVTGATIVRTFPLGDGGFDDRFSLVWWPSSPTLIDAELALESDDQVVDRVGSYTALRSIEVVDGQLKLNGRPYPLRMVLDQGYWPLTGATPPDVAALERDIELTKQLGFNGARKHQKVEDARYFALADRLGLLCWVEMPSAYRPGPRTAATLLSEWIDILQSHLNHPSVIAWVPINESWGVPACETTDPQRLLITAMRDAAHAIDGTRPVSANDGWETVGGQIVGVHDYDQDPAALAERWGTPDGIDAVLAGRRPDGKKADLDQRRADGRAVVLSEFGGIALATDTDGKPLGTTNWGYDTADSPDGLLQRYRDLWAVVHESSGLAGACWTQLTDTYQEVNGLLTMDREPKSDLTALREATRGR